MLHTGRNPWLEYSGVAAGGGRGCRHRPVEGRSQPHSPGWARVPLSSFFPQISINFSTLLIFFLILALRVGDSPTRKGPGYATGTIRNTAETTSLFMFDTLCTHTVDVRLSSRLAIVVFKLADGLKN